MGAQPPEAVALGKSLGAGSVVVGDIVRVGPDVRLDLKLLSTSGDSQPLARATITSAPDSISALTDSVTWAVLRQVWRRGEPPSPSYANLTTRSVASLRAFLEGEQFTVAGRWPEAIDAYDTGHQGRFELLACRLAIQLGTSMVVRGQCGFHHKKSATSHTSRPSASGTGCSSSWRETVARCQKKSMSLGSEPSSSAFQTTGPPGGSTRMNFTIWGR